MVGQHAYFAQIRAHQNCNRLLPISSFALLGLLETIVCDSCGKAVGVTAANSCSNNGVILALSTLHGLGFAASELSTI